MGHIIQYLSWPNHGLPKDVRSLLNVFSENEEAQKSLEVKGPVIVVCRYCSKSVLLKDMFSAIKFVAMNDNLKIV